MPKESPEETARKLERAVQKGDITSSAAAGEIKRLRDLKSTPPPGSGIRSRHSVGANYVSSNRESDGGGDLVEAAAGVAVQTAVGVALGETPGAAFAEAVVEEIVDTVFGDD